MKVTADDIAQLLASSPPRQVPTHVARAAVGRGPGWFLPLFGLAIGAFSSGFVAVFFPWRCWDDWRLAGGGTRAVPGVITAVNRTNLSLNKTRVMEYEFRYTPDDGRLRQDRCYTTGNRWARGMGVTVNYLVAAPDVACVESARLSKSGTAGLVLIIFPLTSGGLIAWFVVCWRRTRRLLREGFVAEVNVRSVEETSMQVNKQNVYRIVLSSPIQPDGPPVMIKRVNRPEVELARQRASDKQPVFVLYDPRRPAWMLFPEALIDN